MYQAILICLLINQASPFIHDDPHEDLTKKNLEIVHNLFIDPPTIRASLVDVSDEQLNRLHKRDAGDDDDDGSSAAIRLALQNGTASLLQSDQLNRLKATFPALRHSLFKRDNYYSENDDDQLEIGLNEDLDRLKMEFTPFYITRSALPGDATNKQIIREYIISKFNNLKMKTYKQPFTIASTSSNQVKKGANIFSYYPSVYRRQAYKENRRPLGDRILVMGAHYDTVSQSPGIDDNASGVVNLLELARLLNENRVNLNYTIIFVCFDFEELGLHGSKAFVDKFLIPTEIVERQSQFMGAYITDMLLNYNNEPNTQTLPSDITKKVPKMGRTSEDNQFRGNYIAVWNRKGFDKELWTKLSEVWNGSPDKERFKLFNMDPRLPYKVTGKYSDLGTFIRSDHANFWFPKNYDKSLNAVLLTDLGPWRSESKVCYHRACDDAKQLTAANLEFFRHTNRMLYKLITENPPNPVNSAAGESTDSTNRNRSSLLGRRPLVSNRIPRAF